MFSNTIEPAIKVDHRTACFCQNRVPLVIQSRWGRQKRNGLKVQVGSTVGEVLSAVYSE